MTSRLFCVFLFCCVFSAFAEKNTFVLTDDVIGTFETSPEVRISVTQARVGGGYQRELYVTCSSTAGGSFFFLTLKSYPTSRFGQYAKLDVYRLGSFPARGHWDKWFVFEDERCLGPAPKRTVVEDPLVLADASRLACEIGEFFRSGCTEEPKKVGPAILAALELPTGPGFLVGGIRGYWTTQQTRDGRMETLRFDGPGVTWIIQHSSWKRGPLEMPEMEVRLVWKNGQGSKTHELTVTKLKGKISGSSTLTGPLREEKIKDLVRLSEDLLSVFRKGSDTPLPEILVRQVSEVIKLSPESFIAD